MSKREQLNLYIRQIQRRLRLSASVRGAAILALTAIGATLLITIVLNAYAFPENGITPARLILLLLVVVAASFGLCLPLLRIDKRRSITQAEKRFPELQQRLLTFSERDAAHLNNRTQENVFVELLAADTLTLTADASPAAIVPPMYLLATAAVAIICFSVLSWLIVARPGYMGYGASLLWIGPRKDVAPLYEVRVAPGDVAVRRNSDQMVTAQVVGLQTSKATLYARYQSGSKWEPVPMQPQMDNSGFQFLFAGLPESVEYYVAAGPATSKHFKFRVVDLPAVKQLQVTYHYPRWTGMQQVSEEHGGDLRALEGTDAELTVTMTSPLNDGVLMLDGGQPIHLNPVGANTYRGNVHMEKDGAYHVAAIDKGQPVRLSEDYFISTTKADPPSVAIERPGAEYRASPIEEVAVGVKAAAAFGLHGVTLHYSVNGGSDQTVSVLKQAGAKDISGNMTLSLEDFKLVPGDVVSLYATAKDAHTESRTEISFIQIEPFEREYSQSQQSGGGGGGGGQNNQGDITRREKELIEATWKQQNDKTATSQQTTATGKLLSEAQLKLKEQALALTARMQSRDLSQANEEFNSFEQDMQKAAAAMEPSAEKLKQMQWQDAIPIEQKALQALLRAEATFRKIEVAFGQRGGGGGGGGGSAGRDLAGLFDLEMDTQKNQYETAQTGSPAEQQEKKVDDALAKLDALAKRQEELAAQQANPTQTFQQRWQQEMLRREAEQLQREMEQMQQGASGQQAQSGQASQQGQSNPSRQARTQGKSSANGTADGASDPRATQALERLKAANEEMARGGAQKSPQQISDAAKRAADQLREASNLLGGAQKQQATGRLDSLEREASRLGKEESSQADQIRELASSGTAGEPMTQSQIVARTQQREKLTDARQRLSDDLSQLQKNMRDAARDLASQQPGVASSLRDALSGMDQTDLTNLTQRTADWLRRNINPNSNGTEGEIAQGLKRLDDQMKQAQQMAGNGQGTRSNKQSNGERSAALDHLDRLRGQIESLQSGRTPGSQPGQRPGQGKQAGRRGAGAQQGQDLQQGAGGQKGNGSQQSNGGQGRQQGDDVANGTMRGGGGGAANNNVDPGGQTYNASRQAQNPSLVQNPEDTEKTVQQSLTELNQLRQFAKGDPAAQREIQELVREMQRLDPSRFPGNPAMVEQLHAQVLSGIDKLELQLRRNPDEAQPGQVRTGTAPNVPPAYQDAVAEYYRRLGKAQ